MIGGERMNDVDPADRNIAIVFQNYALYPHMSVADNLAFGLQLRHVPKARDRPAHRRASPRCSASANCSTRKPAHLSGGQRQRVALGRALVREPKAFLLDEPLSNLDAKLRASMRTELIKLHQKLGTTIVHVTHDQVEAMTMGQRICIMKDGEIVQVGAPMEVYRNPADTFVAGFLASPPMNLVAGRLEPDGGQAGGGRRAMRASCCRSHCASAYASQSGNPVIARPAAGGLPSVGRRPERCRRPVPVTAVAIEVLGPEVILVCELGGKGGPEIMVRCPRDFVASAGPGADVALRPQPDPPVRQGHDQGPAAAAHH